MLKRVCAALVLFLIAAVGCRRSAPVSTHARVACVGCHQEGGGDDPAHAGVPNATCTSAACHPDGGPARARVAGVAFDHEAHPDGHGGTVACASCHTHQAGDSLRLRAGPESCTLCHYNQLAAAPDSGCASCHPSPRHTRQTSQGLSLPHATLRDAHIPCTRCHYRLAEGNVTDARSTCLTCHAAPRRGPLVSTGVADSGLGAVDSLLSADSAHAEHRTVACSACHTPVVHRVVAMSSTISLECTACHNLRHNPSIAADSAPDSTCGNCHEHVHREEQEMIIGLMPGDSARPSTMFMGGVTCQSCHVREDRPGPRPGESLTGSAASCTGCHGGAWEGVLARWRRGYDRRHDWVAGYLDAAQRAVGDSAAPTAARTQLREARGLLDFTARAGPLHNLQLTDELMRRALRLAGQAYRTAGRPVPPPPYLGPAVASGNCVSCHYGIEEARAGTDSTGHAVTHARHILGARLPCSACHAVGAAPPGFSGRLPIDSPIIDSAAARLRN